MRSRTMALAAAVVLTAACRAPAAPDVAGVRAAINELRTAINAGDSTAFLALLTDDFEVLPPASEPLAAPASQSLFRTLFRESSPTLDPFSNEQLQVDGNLAVQRYSFRLTLRPKVGGTPTSETGSGLHVWRRAAGRWKLWKDIWTAPPAPARS